MRRRTGAFGRPNAWNGCCACFVVFSERRVRWAPRLVDVRCRARGGPAPVRLPQIEASPAGTVGPGTRR